MPSLWRVEPEAGPDSHSKRLSSRSAALNKHAPSLGTWVMVPVHKLSRCAAVVAVGGDAAATAAAAAAIAAAVAAAAAAAAAAWSEVSGKLPVVFRWYWCDVSIGMCCLTSWLRDRGTWAGGGSAEKLGGGIFSDLAYLL